MQEKDIVSALKSTDRLIHNDYYFRYIFRKTEKIVCAVFYILSLLDKNLKEDTLVGDVESQALHTLSLVSLSLSSPIERVEEVRNRLVHEFVILESKLRVLHASGRLSQDHLNVFIAELDIVTRSIRGLGMQAQTSSPRDLKQPTYNRHKGIQNMTHQTPQKIDVGGQSDRQRRILELLRAEPNVSIKDISERIKDCSQKTIQRELNDMIEKGHVIRVGEKRWSRYSVTG